MYYSHHTLTWHTPSCCRPRRLQTPDTLYCVISLCFCLLGLVWTIPLQLIEATPTPTWPSSPCWQGPHLDPPHEVTRPVPTPAVRVDTKLLHGRLGWSTESHIYQEFQVGEYSNREVRGSTQTVLEFLKIDICPLIYPKIGGHDIGQRERVGRLEDNYVLDMAQVTCCISIISQGPGNCLCPCNPCDFLSADLLDLSSVFWDISYNLCDRICN